MCCLLGRREGGGAGLPSSPVLEVCSHNQVGEVLQMVGVRSIDGDVFEVGLKESVTSTRVDDQGTDVTTSVLLRRQNCSNHIQ